MENIKKTIELEEGAGGKKSEELIGEIRKILNFKKKWKNVSDDGAVYDLGKEKLVFTSDGFIVDPIFFPGGDIGKIAVCGTLNDLAVMGARPIGLSLSIIIEEGFSRADLRRVMLSINRISEETGVPIVTGDTKVTEKGKIDKIEITTSGVGLAEGIISNSGSRVGDKVIVSGDIGEHAVALLSARFNYKTKIKSDCQPLVREMQGVRKYLSTCKDPTRGGLAAVLNEIADKSKVKIILEEDILPFKKETEALSGLLGIDRFAFPSEGRFVATVSEKDSQKVLRILRKFNPEAKIIGEVGKGRGVYLKMMIGSFKKIETPRGKLIPRIC